MKSWSGRQQHGDYPVIASGVDPHIVTLEKTDVDTLHDFVTLEFLPHMATVKPQQLAIDDLDTMPGTAAVSSKWGWDRFVNPTAQCTEFTGLVFNRVNPDSWKLYILAARNKFGAIDQKIMSDYILHINNGQIVTAKRKARFIFTDMNSGMKPDQDYTAGLSSYDRALKGNVFDAIYDALTNATDETTVERVMYERPLDAAACGRLILLLSRVMTRSQHGKKAIIDYAAVAERARQRRQRRAKHGLLSA